MLKYLLNMLLESLRPSLARRLWVKEYQKTDYRTDSFMYQIAREATTMSNQDDWIYGIIPKDEADRMRQGAERLERNMDAGITIVLSADNQSAIDLCRAWDMAMTGNPKGWVRMSAFMMNLISTIENHLHDEGIDPYED
jgi:hypothetical protein